MKYKNTVAWLIEISNQLDAEGQVKMSDALDNAVKIITAAEPGQVSGAGQVLKELASRERMSGEWVRKIIERRDNPDIVLDQAKRLMYELNYIFEKIKGLSQGQ